MNELILKIIELFSVVPNFKLIILFERNFNEIIKSITMSCAVDNNNMSATMSDYILIRNQHG